MFRYIALLLLVLGVKSLPMDTIFSFSVLPHFMNPI